jgi:acetyltransferase-like isoleucine patch superfamily enzyme
MFGNNFMKESVASLLSKYSWLELFIFAFYTTKNLINKFYSGLVFKLKCRVNGVDVGPGFQVWGKVIINKFPGSQIHIGNQLRIVSSPGRYAFNIFPQSKIRTVTPKAQIIIGNNVGFNSISITARSRTIRIGNGTMLGGNCQIMDSDGHPLWPPESRWVYPGDEYDRPVDIGNNVFVGLNVLILKGVTIGDNSIIAAGSVVATSIPENCLAAGMPAKVIKKYST